MSFSREQLAAFLRGPPAAVFAIAVLLWAEPSSAHSALAVGTPANIVHDGFSYGYSNNLPTRDAARKKALSLCR